MRRMYVLLMAVLMPYLVFAQQSGGQFLESESKAAAKSIWYWLATVFFNLPVALLFAVIIFAGWVGFKAYREAKENRDENAGLAGLKVGFLSMVFGGLGAGALLYGIDKMFGSNYLSAVIQLLRNAATAVTGQ